MRAERNEYQRRKYAERKHDPAFLEAGRKKTARWRATRSEARRAADIEARYVSMYGVNYAQREAILADQGGVCAVCHQPVRFDGTNSGAHLDHDHATGKVRGVLCRNHNTGLGLFQDSPETLEAAAAYLRKHSEKAAN